jgi:hypothetical protein
MSDKYKYRKKIILTIFNCWSKTANGEYCPWCQEDKSKFYCFFSGHEVRESLVVQNVFESTK